MYVFVLCVFRVLPLASPIGIHSYDISESRDSYSSFGVRKTPGGGTDDVLPRYGIVVIGISLFDCIAGTIVVGRSLACIWKYRELLILIGYYDNSHVPLKTIVTLVLLYANSRDSEKMRARSVT